MKVSTRTEYGLLAMLDLADHAGLGPVQSHDIAERQEIPEPYLNQLLTLLRKAGLITSRRGPGGGHLLGRPASEITLADLVSALEGPLWSGEETSKRANHGVRSEAIEEVWREVADSTQRILAGITLADLAERERQRAFTYHI